MKKGSRDKLNLEKGVRFLKISFFCLIAIFVIFSIYLLFIGAGLSELISIIFRKPNIRDFFVIFAGAIVFGFAPFFIGAKLKK